MTARTLRRSLVLLLALGAAACGDTLLDHRADPALLGPVCAANQVSCGGTCLTCNTPPFATPVCQAGGCGFACVGGYNLCGGGTSCVAEVDTSCGASCQNCLTMAKPANSTAACNTTAHACEVTCSPGYVKSAGACVQATAVSVGFDHSCALLADQTVKCWGANERGEVGTGTTADASTPSNVALPAGASAIAAGYNHSCALVGGKVYCWGDNTYGQVGSGSASLFEPNPVEVVGITNAVGIGAGNTGRTSNPYGHTCAILAGGALRCWGANTAGQLGNGTAASWSGTPVPVSLPAGVQARAISAGERHTCALTTAGAVYCWGASAEGQLGLGAVGQIVPSTATIPSGAVAIAAGELHSCAIVGTTVECWGVNLNGQVDASTMGTSWAVPQPSGGLGGNFPAVVLGAGRAHTCAQKSGAAEAPKCFGDNTRGQLGNQPFTLNLADALLSPGADSIGGGNGHTCALTGGGIQCWGDNTRGQLGRGTVTTVQEFRSDYVSGR